LVASIETLRAELSRLKAEPEALVEKTHHEQTEFTHDHAIETRRLATRIEVLRVQLLDQQAQRESSRVQLQHEQIRYDETKKLIAGGLDTKVALLPIVARRDLLQKQVELFGKTIEEMEGQRSKAEATLKDFPQPVRADVDKMLAPLRAAIDAQDARIRALQLETSKLEIRVPISGRIVAIHKRPGQAVRAGDPIVTIAAESGSYIVAHLRENQNQNVKAGVPVEIRPRSSMNVVSKSVVVRIGPQISEVPSHQRRDASRPEWGLPVRIAVPPDVKLRPGELVDLNFDFPKAQSSS
jgi:multidrug resistance efflux pump